MKRLILVASMTAFVGLAPAQATDIGIDLHLRFGDPVPAPVHIAEPPVFLYPPALGFYVAVGVPYDCFYVGGHYYLYRGDRWFIANHYAGPWHYIKHRHMPPGLAKHPFRTIVKHRNAEYNAYKSNRGGYGGKTFHPGSPGQSGKPGKPGKGHGKGKGKWK